MIFYGVINFEDKNRLDKILPKTAPIKTNIIKLSKSILPNRSHRNSFSKTHHRSHAHLNGEENGLFGARAHAPPKQLKLIF